MEAKFDNLQFKNIDRLISGFVTGEQKENLKFHFIATPNITFNDAMQLIQSMTTHFLSAVIKQHPEAKEDIYDAYNFMASSVLNNLIPDFELRKDMDEEAIMAREKEMIEEQYAKRTPEQKDKALKDIDKFRERLLGDLNGKSTEDNS